MKSSSRIAAGRKLPGPKPRGPKFLLRVHNFFKRFWRGFFGLVHAGFSFHRSVLFSEPLLEPSFPILIGPPKRKRFPCLEPRIFAVIKCKPAFGERSPKGAAIGIFHEPQPFERAQKLGRHQFDYESILVAEFLGR